jgi:hypothetical protein
VLRCRIDASTLSCLPAMTEDCVVHETAGCLDKIYCAAYHMKRRRVSHIKGPQYTK